jgi:pantoate--beta-alanine ligase
LKQIQSLPELGNYLDSIRNTSGEIGFIPTMGALHAGHLSLVNRSIAENAETLVSIFVNPLQFNDPEDLKKYPRTLEQDIDLLSKAGCNAVFIPTSDIIYTRDFILPAFDLGYLDTVMEGTLRPGHFEGVAQVVFRLLSMILPTRAYFGEKDFQQLQVIHKVVHDFALPVKIIPCPTVRENNGLAMSSRNNLLTSDERSNAGFIYEVLQHAVSLSKNEPAEVIRNSAVSMFKSHPEFTLEYFVIAHNETLQSLSNSENAMGARAFVAVRCGKVRLIDNILLN